MSLRERLAIEEESRDRHLARMPFRHERAGWHVLQITAGEAAVLGALGELFGRHESGELSAPQLIHALDRTVRIRDSELWASSFPDSDEGPAARLLEDIGFCRALDAHWVVEELGSGNVEAVQEQSELQATARDLAERFVPIWLSTQALASRPE